MACSKAPAFDKLSQHQSQWSKALSHPARIRILAHLKREGITPFYTLTKIIPLARTTISQHLRTLRLAGLVKLHEEYPHSFYELESTICKTYLHEIKALEKELNFDN